jgi:D-alanyl-D-alanine carboxypeptidase (penicillin-binding protein 5/6)
MRILDMKTKRVIVWMVWVVTTLFIPNLIYALPFNINARSAILIDTRDERILYEKNADSLIAPASITKVISLFLVFDAIREGRARLWDTVVVSPRAASTGGSRMGLRAGDEVPLEEIIKGMAVVSGNDACVAVAEHLAGSVERFVKLMNIKARQLGMRNTVFMTPNGLPAKGQLTTARDISKLSLAYLRRFPESLSIHSMCSYTYRTSTHRNANRLLGKCPGVDGIKTGFVCASGYNLSATAKRGNVRLLAVVMGAPSAGVRAIETAKLLEYGFQVVGEDGPQIREVEDFDSPGRIKIATDSTFMGVPQCEPERKSKVVKAIRYENAKPEEADGTSSVASKRSEKSSVAKKKTVSRKVMSAGKTAGVKQSVAVKKSVVAKKTQTVAQAKTSAKAGSGKEAQVAKNASVVQQKAAKSVKTAKPVTEEKKKIVAVIPNVSKAKPLAPSSAGKTTIIQKAQPRSQSTKEKKG